MKSYTFEYVALVLTIALICGVFAWIGSESLWLALIILGVFTSIAIAFLLGRKIGRSEMNVRTNRTH